MVPYFNEIQAQDIAIKLQNTRFLWLWASSKAAGDDTRAAVATNLHTGDPFHNMVVLNLDSCGRDEIQHAVSWMIKQTFIGTQCLNPKKKDGARKIALKIVCCI